MRERERERERACIVHLYSKDTLHSSQIIWQHDIHTASRAFASGRAHTAMCVFRLSSVHCRAIDVLMFTESRPRTVL